MEPAATKVCPFSSLEETILVFYQSENPRRLEAQTFLDELHNSPDIYEIIWKQMLPSKCQELQFQGATILHSKILNHFADIPLNQLQNLKSKLLEAIIYFSDKSKLLLSRLCIVFSVFLLRSIAAQWSNGISDMIAVFQPQNIPSIPQETLASIVLEILTNIAEQFQTLLFSKNERIFARSALVAESTTLISLLEDALGSNNLEIISQALKSTKAWFEFGLPIEDCDKLLDLLINVVAITYNNVEYSSSSISAIEAISCLCNNPAGEKYIKTITKYLQKILTFEKILQDERSGEFNSDLVPCLYTLFIEIADTHTRILVKLLQEGNSEMPSALCKIILQATNAPGYYPRDEVYSIHSLNFWYQLQDNVLEIEDSRNKPAFHTVKQYYEELVPILLKKSMFPENLSSWSKDDQDTFRCYKQDIADSYMYCFPILGQNLLNSILSGLNYAISDISTVNQRWREVETYMHAFHALAETLSTSDDPIVISFIITVQNLPLQNMNYNVALTALELLGSYAEWFYNHPDYLGATLRLILIAVMNKDLSPTASLTLKEIARECHLVLTPYAEPILLTAEEMLSKKNLGYNEQARLVFAMGKFMTSLSQDLMFQHLELIVTPYMKQLHDILPNLNEDKAKPAVTGTIGIFTQLFLSIDVTDINPPPSFVLLQSILPIYKEILKQCRVDCIISAICLSLKCAVSNLTTSCEPLVPDIANFLVTIYKENPQSGFLDVARQIIILFGQDDKNLELIGGMWRELCSKTLHLLETAPDRNISHFTDLLESFYQICSIMVKKRCTIFTHCGSDLASIFRYASLVMCFQESATVKSAASFLSNVITISREEQMFLVLVQTHGLELVYQIMQAICKMAPRSCFDSIIDVLLSLSKKYCDYLSRWLNELFAQENFLSPRINDAAKKRFIKAVLKDQGNRRRVHEQVWDFAFLCRGLVHKQYIEESTASLVKY